MDFFSFIGPEGLVTLGSEIFISLLLVAIYFQLKSNSHLKSPAWIFLLRRAIGFLALSFTLPLILIGIGVFIFDNSPESFVNIVTLLSYVLPMTLSLYFFQKLVAFASEEA